MQHKPKPLSKKRRKNLGNLAVKLHADGMSFVDIAKRFGVNKNCCGCIFFDNLGCLSPIFSLLISVKIINRKTR